MSETIFHSKIFFFFFHIPKAADLVGRKYGKNNKWPFQICNDKSIIGSLAFFICSSVTCIGFSSLMIYTNSLVYDYTMEKTLLIQQILVICFLSTFVELFPIGNDNITVPLFAGILAKFSLS